MVLFTEIYSKKVLLLYIYKIVRMSYHIDILAVIL